MHRRNKSHRRKPHRSSLHTRPERTPTSPPIPQSVIDEFHPLFNKESTAQALKELEQDYTNNPLKLRMLRSIQNALLYMPGAAWDIVLKHPQPVQSVYATQDPLVQLYELYNLNGKLCTQCGIRFHETQQTAYQEHLDWHFKRNQLKKQQGLKCRTWWNQVRGDMAMSHTQTDSKYPLPPIFTLYEGTDPSCSECRIVLPTKWSDELEGWGLPNAVCVSSFLELLIDQRTHPQGETYCVGCKECVVQRKQRLVGKLVCVSCYYEAIFNDTSFRVCSTCIPLLPIS
jgi:hypothetical protein